MNRLIALFCSAAIVCGCATIYPPPPAPVCAAPEAAGSVICEIARRLSTTPEQLDQMFLDASLVGIGTKLVRAADLRRAVERARSWVAEKHILTVDGLVKYLVAESEVDPALALLVSRRLGVINLPDLGLAPLTAYDIALVLKGLDHQLAQLSWF